MASGCVPGKWRKAGRIGKEAEKVYLTRFIVDLMIIANSGLYASWPCGDWLVF